jgi:hypothetical protein
LMFVRWTSIGRGIDALILDGGMNAVTEPKAKKEAAEQKRETAQFIIDDGTETLTSHADGVHLQHQPQQQAVQASSISASDDLVRALKSENDALRKLNLQLSEKCQNLEIEKEEALKQSRMLRRQMEKLTQVLNKA